MGEKCDPLIKKGNMHTWIGMSQVQFRWLGPSKRATSYDSFTI